MLDHPVHNSCEACQVPAHAESPVVLQLIDRIGELENENASLRKLGPTIQTKVHLFEALLRASHEAILLLTPELNVLRLIHSVLDYSEEQIVGWPMLNFVHPDDSHAIEDYQSWLLKGPVAVTTVALRVKNAAGAWVPLEGQFTDLLDDPDVAAIVLNLRPKRG